MERLKFHYENAIATHKELKEIFDYPYSKIVQESTIHRFECCFEATWKFLKEYLHGVHGIECNSPKYCIREAFILELLTAEETEEFLNMADDRNNTTHLYSEKIAMAVFKKITIYEPLIGKLLERAKIN